MSQFSQPGAQSVSNMCSMAFFWVWWYNSVKLYLALRKSPFAAKCGSGLPGRGYFPRPAAECFLSPGGWLLSPFPFCFFSLSPARREKFPPAGGWLLSFLTFCFFSFSPARRGPCFFPRRKKHGEKGRPGEFPRHPPSGALLGSFQFILCGKAPGSTAVRGRGGVIAQILAALAWAAKAAPMVLACRPGGAQRRSQSRTVPALQAARWRGVYCARQRSAFPY